ncbi:outer membrane beta-barrel protein [Flavobacterium sp.]|uniref:outer membrane beta-barrel protein n=1 Tax=Flavobacterium sp. TaxID=239 RepID=UPI003D1176A5
MKSKITAILALLAFSFANAQQQEVDEQLKTGKGVQFEKGDMFMEGSIKISTGGTNDYYGLSPQFGYFLNDKIAIGGKLSFSSNEVKKASDESDAINGTKTTQFGVGAFARYYFLELASKRFKAYSEVGLGYGHNKTEINSYSDTSNSITADINVGLNYFFTKNLAVSFTLANILSYNSVSPENGPSSNTFNLNLNLFENIFDTPQFGLLYRF